MKVVVYYRTRPCEPDVSTELLEVQRKAVVEWLAEHDATAVGEFTEAESGGKSRPQLGKALAACRREDWRLLIARTNPIGSGPGFGPFSNGISRVRCEQITQPIGTAVYLRSRPSEPEASDAALEEQGEAVKRWLAERPTIVLGEFIESEGDETERPALAAAVATCVSASSGATLLIGTLAAIGGGSAAALPAISIPVAVAWTPEERPVFADEMPLPSAAFDAPFLCCGISQGRWIPVYLCNPGPYPLVGASVASVGETTHWAVDAAGELGGEASPIVPLATSVANRPLRTIDPGVCTLLERYDVFWDGDFVTSYRITFLDAQGDRHTLGAVIGTGGPETQFLKLTPVGTRTATVPAST